MIDVLVEAAAVFGGCLVLHVIIWRVRRPESYRVWLPLLVAIFLVAGPLAEWTWTPGGGIRGLGLVRGLAVVPHYDDIRRTAWQETLDGLAPVDVRLARC